MRTSRTAVLGLVGVLVIGGVSCGHLRDRRASDASSTTTTATSSSSTAKPSAAGSTATTPDNPTSTCTPTPPAGTTRETIDSGGESREFLVTVPDNPGDAPLPLVLDFHGLGASDTQQEAYSHFGTEAAQRGYATITPQATKRVAMWTLPPLPGADDIGFVSDLLSWADTQLCTDPARVSVAGISNGAAFAAAVSCRLAPQISAVGLVAGPNAYPVCTDQGPMPLIAFHGTGDPIVPYDGGAMFKGDPEGTLAQLAGRDRALLKPTEEALATWATQRNGCTNGPDRQSTTEHVSLIAYRDCRDGADASLYRIEGGGHTWPGATSVGEKVLGETTTEIAATPLMLDFFDAQH